MRSFVLTNDNAETTVAAGGNIPVGDSVHGYGNDVAVKGNSILMKSPGYYAVNVSVTAEATGTADVSVGLYIDGAAVTGASTTITPSAVGNSVEFNIPWVFRKTCCCDYSRLTVVPTVGLTCQNVIVSVRKL